MNWIFSRRKPKPSVAVPHGLVTGSHRSPGFEVVCHELSRRVDPKVLDLGQPSTENVSFLSQYAHDVSVADLFRSCGGVEGDRAEPFRFADAASLPLPESEAPFDVVLVWDLFHFFTRSDLPAFAARLHRLTRSGALVFLSISATTPIPSSPVLFKIEATDRLGYGISSAARLPALQFTPREVEKIMVGFSPVRSFQLRSGLQELLFHRGE